MLLANVLPYKNIKTKRKNGGHICQKRMNINQKGWIISRKEHSHIRNTEKRRFPILINLFFITSQRKKRIETI